MSLGFHKKKKTDIALILLVLLLMIYALMGSDAEAYIFTPGGKILFYEGETADNPKNLVITFNPESCLPWNRLAIIQSIKNVERQLEFYYGLKLISYGGLTTTPKQMAPMNWDNSEITIHCALGADMLRASGSRTTRGYVRHNPSCPVTNNCIGDAEMWIHTDLNPWWEIQEVIAHEFGHLRFYLIHAFYAPFATMKINFYTARNPERSQRKESYSTDDLCGFNAKYPMPSLVGKYWVGDQGSEFKALVRYPIGENDPNLYTEFSVRYQLKTFPDGTPYQELISSYPYPGEICVEHN